MAEFAWEQTTDALVAFLEAEAKTGGSLAAHRVLYGERIPDDDEVPAIAVWFEEDEEAYRTASLNVPKAHSVTARFSIGVATMSLQDARESDAQLARSVRAVKALLRSEAGRTLNGTVGLLRIAGTRRLGDQATGDEEETAIARALITVEVEFEV